ncbi:hypothetical protein ACVWZV_006023 [Bradyrhizobium sp. GM5.1]
MTQPPLDLLREARNLTSLLVIVLAGPRRGHKVRQMAS